VFYFACAQDAIARCEASDEAWAEYAARVFAEAAERAGRQAPQDDTGTPMRRHVVTTTEHDRR